MISLNDIGVLVTDWDETVTKNDTIGLLAEAAYEHKPDLEPPWSHYVEEYLKDYRAYYEAQDPSTTLDAEREILRGLDSVDSASLKRVEEGRVFAGVPREVILAKSTKVEVRPGWWGLYEAARSRGIKVVVLTVNWSSELIRQVFLDAGYDTQDLTIYSDEIEMGPDGCGTGSIIAPLRTAVHKKEVIEKLKAQHGKRLCYIGDSSTDLLGILEADLGVIMAKRSLVDRLRGLGINVHEHGSTLPVGTVHFAPDWTALRFE
jgi:2-hydroxy-3-keto-5-methylthiopentenyl-1-phosphate phosphatase